MTLNRFDLTRIQAITLDLDDTLWEVEPTIRNAEVAMRAFLQKHAPKASTLFGNSQVIKPLRDALMLAEPNLMVDMGAFRRRLIGEVLLRTDEDMALVEPAFEVFYTERNKVHHYEDSLEALSRLSSRFRLLALTNGNADVHRVGIGHHFVGSIGAGQIGIAKPDPRIFHAALASLALTADEVLHVGDDPRLDVQGAMQAGIAAVWVNRKDHLWPLEQAPTLQVNNLLDLCHYLQC